MIRFLALLFLPSFALASGNVDVKIAWDMKELGEARMKIHETSPKRPLKLWQMGTGPDAAKLPIGPEIAGSTVRVPLGGHRKFMLVLTNPTDKPLYFFAAPHAVIPPELSLGFKFKCLCINHAFKVGPKETWYRVVELRVSPGYVGEGMEIKHTVIGISEERMKKFSMPLDEAAGDT